MNPNQSFRLQVFRGSDPAYSERALAHARQLLAFAADVPGSFAASVPEMGDVYPSSGWRDDMAWAAAWLWTATADEAFLGQAQLWLARSRQHEPDR